MIFFRGKEVFNANLENGFCFKSFFEELELLYSFCINSNFNFVLCEENK